MSDISHRCWRGWLSNNSLQTRKSEFGRRHIRYLGHMISETGVEMDGEKVSMVVEWPEPRNIKELRGFWGLTRYYQRFIRDYAKMARPLTDMLKNGKFEWLELGAAVMRDLKEAVTTTPVLALPNFSQTFHVECDASRKGVRVVLPRNKMPIAYFNKALSKSSLTKFIYEKELMALALAIQHCRPYLLG